MEEQSTVTKPQIALKITNVCFSYNHQVRALNDVSFQIRHGDYVCIIGHNGSGKSTLSKIFAGLIFPQSGTIELFDQPLQAKAKNEVLQKIKIVFQNPDNQFIGLTTEDDIAFGLENLKVPHDLIDGLIENVAAEIEISHLLKKESLSLSGGQKQQVAIASVLAMNPQVVLFDESTSMLDPAAKAAFKKKMKILSTVHKKTVISITHDMEEVLQADWIIVMNQGRVIKEGTKETIFNDEVFLREVKLDVPFNVSLILECQKVLKTLRMTLSEEVLLKQLCHFMPI